MVSIASSGSYAANNSTALFLLRGATPAGNSATSPQSAAAQILAPRIGPDLDPLSMAVGEIIRIALENGGQFIVGGAFSKIEGTDGDDRIYGGPGSSVNGGAGNDYIAVVFASSANGGTGNDMITGFAGNTLSGDAGDDSISGYSKNTINGDSGNDNLGVFGSDNQIDGGDGNDYIHVERGSNVVTGGTGDDYIKIGTRSIIQVEGGMFSGTGSTIKYAAGDGKDAITVDNSDVTLAFGEGISTENTRIEISGNKALISFAGNDADQITVHLDSESSLTLAFADGSTWKLGYSAPVAAAAYTEH